MIKFVHGNPLPEGKFKIILKYFPFPRILNDACRIINLIDNCVKNADVLFFHPGPLCCYSIKIHRPFEPVNTFFNFEVETGNDMLTEQVMRVDSIRPER